MGMTLVCAVPSSQHHSAIRCPHLIAGISSRGPYVWPTKCQTTEKSKEIQINGLDLSFKSLSVRHAQDLSVTSWASTFGFGRSCLRKPQEKETWKPRKTQETLAWGKMAIKSETSSLCLHLKRFTTQADCLFLVYLFSSVFLKVCP